MTEQTNSRVEGDRGTHDGSGSADHDQEYKFGKKPKAIAPYPFKPREYAKLLITRGKAWESDHPNLGRFRIKE